MDVLKGYLRTWGALVALVLLALGAGQCARQAELRATAAEARATVALHRADSLAHVSDSLRALRPRLVEAVDTTKRAITKINQTIAKHTAQVPTRDLPDSLVKELAGDVVLTPTDSGTLIPTIPMVPLKDVRDLQAQVTRLELRYDGVLALDSEIMLAQQAEIGNLRLTVSEQQTEIVALKTRNRWQKVGTGVLWVAGALILVVGGSH